MTLSRTLYASFVHLSVVATVNTIASLQLELLSTVKTCASLHITVKTHIHHENFPLLAPTVKAAVKTFGPRGTIPSGAAAGATYMHQTQKSTRLGN